MLEILLCDDKNSVAELYKSCGVSYEDNKLAIRAMFGDECLGFCLFEITGEHATIFVVEPKEDTMLADGLLRSALHVGTERGITDAFYLDSKYEDLYQKINFLEDKSEKRLKLQNLFSGCCNCNK
jgi:hypothetical protein